MNLEESWMRLWAQLTHESVQPYFIELAKRYSEPHRAYHNMVHLGQVIGEFSSVRHLADSPIDAELGLWYHDSFYDPKAKDNEEKSAFIAADDLRKLGQEQRIVPVTEIIIDSKHIRVPKTWDAKLTLDCDLSILGQPRVVFDEYERNIRKEYLWVDDAAFRAGRSKVLQSFLDKPTVFHTPFFIGKYESAARENLKRSIDALSH